MMVQRVPPTPIPPGRPRDRRRRRRRRVPRSPRDTPGRRRWSCDRNLGAGRRRRRRGSRARTGGGRSQPPRLDRGRFTARRPPPDVPRSLDPIYSQQPPLSLWFSLSDRECRRFRGNLYVGILCTSREVLGGLSLRSSLSAYAKWPFLLHSASESGQDNYVH